MLKIFYIPYPDDFYVDYHCPRGTKIVRDGLSQMKDEVQIVANESEADINLLDYVPHIGKEKYNRSFVNQFNSNRLVVVDYQDEVDNELIDGSLLYFKRSWVGGVWDENLKLHTRREPRERPANYRTFSYAALDEYFRPVNKWQHRDIDIGCYLRNDTPNRAQILGMMGWIKRNNPQFNIQVGAINNATRSKAGAVTINEEYMQTLARTRLLITCNPGPWEGDQRLWEGLASRCCVFVDNMYTPYPGALEDGKHVIYYPMDNLQYLGDKINYYLNNSHEAHMLSWAGYNNVLLNHNPAARARYIVDETNKALGRTPLGELATRG